ncbi:MAG TPA: peptidoglycan DD-metalloendopeptidase family protein, partial [Chitinophagaceae bacterium]|nr:peptidoglycan DD-metalloendopeptidase family protein [Chitinophagaceae bacterium]
MMGLFEPFKFTDSRMHTDSQLTNLLKRSMSGFHPVVPFDPAQDRLLRLDFTEANTELHPSLLEDTAAFSDWVNGQLAGAGARYGVGGYGEHRTIYSRSRVFDAPEGEEPRRLHLGLDIWGRPGTPVYAPLDGIVHSFQFNNAFGDYGATILLSHQLEGLTFYTLYGHLSLASLQN